MWRWFGQSMTSSMPYGISTSQMPFQTVAHLATSVAVEDGNDSDVSLLIVNDDESVVTETSTIPPAEEGQCGEPVATVNPPEPIVALPSVEVTAAQSSTGGTNAGHRRDDTNANHRRRRHHRHRRSSSNRHHDRYFHFKMKERNYLSAMFDLVVVVLMCVAMFEPCWIHVQGDRCNLEYLSMKTFLDPNSSDFHKVKDCVSTDLIGLMRIIIVLSFLVLVSSFTACVLDVLGPSRVFLRVLRSTASCSIFSAAICTLMTGMCFLVTQQMVKFIEMNKMYESSRVVVEFDIGFYMVTAAGALSILAVASTLMCVSRSTTNAARGWSHDPVMEPTDGQLLDADACRLNRAASACNAQTARAPPPYRP